jgi:hypothetical protein
VDPNRPLGQNRRGRWKTILIVIVIALVLCCGGGGFGLYKFLSSVSAPVRNAANAFADDLAADRLDSAYGRLCADTQKQYPPDAFTQYVHDQPKFTKHSTRGFSTNDDNGRHTGTVTMDLVLTDGSKQQHVFELVKEGDAYKVCGDPY